MNRKPHDNEKGVFTWQVDVDMILYGIIMGVLRLVTFIIIVYGPGTGRLDHDCNRSCNNNSYVESCDIVFRARAAVFAELRGLILIAAWEIKSIRRSMFRLDPLSDSRFPFFKDIYENWFLFWAVVIVALIVFPYIYIPGLNTAVFKHKGKFGSTYSSVTG